MALLDITEYQNLAQDDNGNRIAAGREPSLGNQQVAIGGGSLQSAALGGVTRFVRLHADATCRIAFGVNPTAAATSQRMVAGQTEYFGVQPGIKIAVITSA